MSKISPKQRYIQLTSWLETFNKKSKNQKKIKPQSRLSYYKSKNN